MNNKKQAQIEMKIKNIKNKIRELKPMRPGKITTQYKDKKTKTGAYLQINYTYKMKSITEYLRPQFEGQIQKEIESFNEFKKLSQTLIDLSLELSKLKIKNKIEDLP